MSKKAWPATRNKSARPRNTPSSGLQRSWGDNSCPSKRQPDKTQRQSMVHGEDGLPVHTGVVEEPIRRHRLAPPIACLRHAGRRFGCHSLHQYPRSSVQARIAQIEVLKFRLRPCCRSVCQLRHAKDESKRDFSRVYKGTSNSLNVNENFGDHAQADGLVYNEVG